MSSPSERRLSFEAPIYEMEARLAELEARYAKNKAVPDAAAIAEQILRLRRELVALKRTVYANLEPWQTVQVSRLEARPQSRDYIDLIFDQFLELHGDRAIGDDRALRTGFARLADYRIMLIGHQKGHTLKERSECLYGCAHPEGYRKAYRLM